MSLLLPLLGISLAAAPPRALPGGTLIQEAGPRITCAPPWCVGELSIDAPPEVVRATLQNFSHYPTMFPRVRSVESVSGDVVHVTLQMPFPLQDRDYIIRATSAGDELTLLPVAHPLVEGVVRLPEFSGRWTFQPEGEGTAVVYVWHTDMGADIPEWAWERTWRTQGSEVLGRLKRYVEATYSE